MEANIIITGLEEYRKELDKLNEMLEEMRAQHQKLESIAWNLVPIAEIRKPSAKAEDEATEE